MASVAWNGVSWDYAWLTIPTRSSSSAPPYGNENTRIVPRSFQADEKSDGNIKWGVGSFEHCHYHEALGIMLDLLYTYSCPLSMSLLQVDGAIGRRWLVVSEFHDCSAGGFTAFLSTSNVSVGGPMHILFFLLPL